MKLPLVCAFIDAGVNLPPQRDGTTSTKARVWLIAEATTTDFDLHHTCQHLELAASVMASV